MLPAQKMQSTFAMSHHTRSSIENTLKCTQELQGNTANKVHFIASLASHLEATGCEVQHASVGGDRLIVLIALAVAGASGASVVGRYDKTFS